MAETIIPRRRRGAMFGLSRSIRRINTSKQLSESQTLLVKRYLENPVLSGIWQANTERIDRCLFLDAIKDEVITTLKTKKDEEKGISFKRLERDIDLIGEIAVKEITHTFSFVFFLFKTVCLIQEDKSRSESYLFSGNSPEMEIILKLINLDKFYEKYSTECKKFKDILFHKDMTEIINPGELSVVQPGVFILIEEDLERFGKDIFLSPLKEPIDCLIKFFTLLGMIKECTPRKIHTPEEIVFKPYIVLLKEIRTNMISDKTELRFIEKSINEYEGDNFSNSINSIGLAAEECLIQIYESLFFDSAPQEPLGALNALISKKINEIVSGNIEPPNTENLDKVIELTKSAKEVEKKNYDSLMGLINKRIIDSENYLKKLIDQINNEQFKITVFPRIIKDNLSELIGLRNAVSHRSRVKIGEHDVFRAMYGFISLVTWWQTITEKIDWDKSQKEIILEISRSSGYNN